MTNNNKTITNWTSESKYVDIETGEEITKQNVLENYTHLETEKITNHDKKRVTYIGKYERTKQLKLKFDDRIK